MNSLYKIRKYDFLFIWLGIYFTSKMLWDCLPFVFEGISLFMLLVFGLQSIYANKKDNLAIIYVICCVYIIINSLFLDTTKQFVRACYEYIFYMFIIWSMYKCYSKINAVYCFKFISYFGVVITMLSWYEYITKKYLLTDLSEFGVILYSGNDAFRAAVFTRSFLSHGVVLGVFSLIALFLYYETSQKKWLCISIIDFVTILTTGSRGPLVAFAGAIVVFYWLNAKYVEKSRKKVAQTACFIMMGMIAILILLTTSFTTGVSSVDYFLFRIRSIINWTGDAGNVGRILLWKQAFGWFEGSPLYGIGFSNTGSWGEGSIGVTESGVLKRLVEGGIVGFVLIYTLVFYILIRGLKRMKSCSKSQALILTLLISIFAGVFVNDITVQSTEEIMVTYWYWGSLGGIYYFSEMKQYDMRENELNEKCICNSSKL